MKKRFFLVLLLCLAALFCFAACDEGEKSEGGRTLESIAVTSQPKTEYEEGEFFSRVGMVVTAYYSDDTSEPVMGYTIDKTAALTPADTVVTITYQGKTTTLPIVVHEKEIPVHVRIEDDTVKTYKVEAEDAELAMFEEKMIESAATVTDGAFNPATSGGKALGNLNYSQNVITIRILSEVEAKVAITFVMSYNTPPMPFDEYVETRWNDEVQTTGWTVARDQFAMYKWFDWHEYELSGLQLKKGTNELVLKILAGKESPNYDYFAIDVEPKGELTSLKIGGNYKNTYEVGEVFSRTGLTVSAVWSTGEEKVLKSGLYTIQDASRELTLEDDKMIVSYRGVQAEIPITVQDSRGPITSLEIGGTYKTVYEVGDVFDPTGMTVTAVYQNGAKQLLTASQYTIENADKQLTANDTQVVVVCGDVRQSVTIEVVANPTELRIITGPTKTTYRVGDYFRTEGMVVKAIYDGGREMEITDYELSCAGRPLTQEDKKVTVSYKEQSAEVEIKIEGELTTHLNVQTAEANKGFKVEAEDGTGDFKTENSASSGDKSIGEIHNYSLGIDADGEATVNLVFTFANPWIDFDANMAIYWNGERILTNFAPSNKAGDNISQWFDWNDYTLYNVKMNEGRNVLDIERPGQWSLNFDYMTVVVKPDNTPHLTISSAEAHTYRMEVENTTLLHTYNNETGGSPSGGSAVGNLSSGFVILIESSIAVKIKVVYAMDAAGSWEFDNRYSSALNGVKFQTGISVVGGSWTNWTPYTATAELELKEGLNVFSVAKLSDSVNFDYIEFIIE